jgi:hypothetical protein
LQFENFILYLCREKQNTKPTIMKNQIFRTVKEWLLDYEFNITLEDEAQRILIIEKNPTENQKYDPYYFRFYPDHGTVPF